MTVPELAPLRRRPMQQRSVQRVERMLDACAALVEEVGYDRVTTTLIAERAEVAVGSLYQFFPDKRAVAQALVLRSVEHFVATLTQRFDQAEFDHLWDAVDMVIDTYAEMHRVIPAFKLLRFGDVIDTHLLDGRRNNNAFITDELIALLSRKFEAPPDAMSIPFAVAVEAADGVLKLAFRVDSDGDPMLIAESKRIVRAYLAEALADLDSRI